MKSFIMRRVLHAIAVLLIVSFALAFLVDLAPGDPAYTILGEQATPEQVQKVRDDLHLDDSLVSRYGRWLGSVVTGDLGDSYRTGRSVSDLIVERLPVTAELIFLALLFALVVSVPIGMYTAYAADRAFDRAWSVISSTLISVPSFVTAIGLVYIFALELRDFPIHFPVTGWVPLTEGVWDNLSHAFLPAVTLALVLIPQFTRLLRADMIATLQEDFILSARARGVPTFRILLRHALRPSLFSLLTLAGISLGHLVGGALIVESLFALPGVAGLLIESVNSFDITLTQGIVAFVVFVYTVQNAALEVVYGYLDPRVRLERV